MKNALKWTGIVIGGLLTLLLVALGAMYFIGSSNVERTYEVQTASLTLPTDSASIAHGKHLTEIYGCADCHGADFSGQVMADAPPFRVVSSNLTSGAGGVGAHYTPEDYDRAIRHGVKADGRSVLIMPSAAYHKLGDADIGAIIAYLQQVPPVDKELPATEVRPLGRLLSAGPFDPGFEVNMEPARVDVPAIGANAEYGAYLSSLCAYCHGDNLMGMEQPPGPPGMPPSPALAAAGQWTLEEFMTAVRTGMRPSGIELRKEFMPRFPAMNDVELAALHAHLGTLRMTSSDT